ncbi:MAG: DUF4388 domain-containing protein, partial [Deltaproteobacteria bacterium]|nr:DUF4388 domain-containing protein [Deltaproteobacteria bacterium]
MTLRGSVDEFPLDAVLRFLAGVGKTGRINLRGAAGGGAVTLTDGRLAGAACGEDDGEAALGALFALKGAEFEFDASGGSLPETLSGGLDEVLARAREERDSLIAIREVIPSDDRVFALSERASSRSRIELSSDQWRTLLTVNGDRDVRGIADALGLLADLVRAGTIDAEMREARSVLPPVSSHATGAQAAPAPAPAPVEEETTWSAPAPAPAPQAEAWETTAPAVESWESAKPAEVWEPATPIEPWEPAKPAETWEPATQAESWAAADESWSAPASAQDDRLAALFGAPAVPALATGSWDAPPPPRVEPSNVEVEVPAHVITRANAEPDGSFSVPVAEPEPERKHGGLLGFGARRETPAPAAAAPGAGTTRAGKLAAFTNALIAEYNSGRYGKQKLDSKITNLLLRVDEQADPVDRPMPTLGDTLS